MNSLSGYVEKELGGKVRGIKFGINAWAIFCDLQKCKLSEVGDRMQAASGFRDLVYSGLAANCRSKKIDLDFDQYDVGDWMDDLKESDIEEIMGALDKSKGNDQSLRAERRETAAKTAKV